MHKNFGEWYRLVEIEPDGASLKKRWAGVKAWATALRESDDDVLETVRIYQGLPSKTSREEFLATFRKQDPAFPQRNDFELQVLAGASLVACVQSVGNDGAGLDTAVLAGTALDASCLRVADTKISEISHEVLGGLETIASDQRKRIPFDLSAMREGVGKAAEALKQVAAAGNWEQLKAAATPAFQGVLDAVRATERELGDAAHNLQCADEETNILWWMEGRCSRDLDKPWTAIKDCAAIMSGTELADLTDIALGPRNAGALLERLLSDSKAKGKETTPLSKYINALPEPWLQGRQAAVDDRALDLAPLSAAIAHRANSGAANWQSYFDASSGLKSSIQLPPVRLARQAYVEAILFRLLREE